MGFGSILWQIWDFRANAVIGRRRLILVCYIQTYVIILVGIFPLTSPPTKYWRGCVPGIPGGVDASEAVPHPSCGKTATRKARYPTVGRQGRWQWLIAVLALIILHAYRADTAMLRGTCQQPVAAQWTFSL